MNKEEAIKKFSLQRPYSKGVYGYGSGVFKQTSATGKPLTDVIFIVDDIAEWHKKNMQMNPSDYSWIGRIHLSRKNIKKLKGKNGITYFSEIPGGEYTFKYGVIEEKDFIEGLETWNNLFMAGRFHKPVLELQSNDDIREVIDYNRNCAIMIACIFSDEVAAAKELYNILCGLSYLGDARMAFAENPHKVENIVDGSFDKLCELYTLSEDYIVQFQPGFYRINHNKILERIYDLPQRLLEFLEEMGTDFNDIDSLRINIMEYITRRNKTESKAQILQGVKTNGIVRSVPYVLAKIRKRFVR